MDLLGRLTWLPMLLGALALSACAANPAVPAAPAQAPANLTQAEAIRRADAAVVGVHVRAVAEGRSNESVGRSRSGSGVVIGPHDLVLTIGYLLLEADAVLVRSRDGRELPAQVLAYDPASGFGLLRPLLPLRQVAPVPLGAAQQAQLGELLMVGVGGEDGGIGLTRLAARRAFTGYWEYHLDQALFTQPPIEPHSGAPLFNQHGELLGIGSLLVPNSTGTGEGQPGNMFVPVDLLKPILAELLQSGSSRASRRPWLGLLSVELDNRVHVLRTSPDSPARAAGLRAGDQVLGVDGVPVTTLEAFYKKLWDRPAPDSEVRLTVLRRGELATLTLRGVDRLRTLRRPRGA